MHTKQIKVYENVTINGKENQDVIGTKLWNLKFGLTKVIGADLERLFCEKPFENSSPCVKDSALFESLKRQKLLFSEELFKCGSDKYLLMNKSEIGQTHKDFDKTKLELL